MMRMRAKLICCPETISPVFQAPSMASTRRPRTLPSLMVASVAHQKASSGKLVGKVRGSAGS